MFRTAKVFLVAGLFFISCDNSAGKKDVKVPYGSQSKNVAHKILYTSSFGGSKDRPLIGRVVGSKEINGKTYSNYLLSDVDASGRPENDTDGSKFWLSPFPLGQDGKMSIAEIEDYGSISGTFDPEATIDLSSEEGVQQQVSTTYTGTVPGFEGTHTVSISGSYTIESKNVTVETSMGKISGCTHIKMNGAFSGDALPEIVKNTNVTAEAWYHETYGTVKVRLPLLGMEMDTQETWDIDDPDGKYRTIKKTGLVSDANPEWKLSTYDMSGDFDADKNTHAKMLLELRWSDEELAKSDQRIDTHPAVRVSFGTIFGTFPHMLVESPVSIFHPEDNGKGYKFYYAYVDEAAKNELGDDGILYEINVKTTDPDVTPDIKATGRIYYRKID